MTLCEYVMDIAEEEAKKRWTQVFDDLVCEIADEILETTEEYEPAASCD